MSIRIILIIYPKVKYMYGVSSTFLFNVLSLQDFCHGKFGLLYLGKASCDRVALPNPPCMLDV